MVNKEYIKNEKASVSEVLEHEDFKTPGSRRERLTETHTTTKVWLLENGKKIKMKDETEDKNVRKETISLGTEENYFKQLELQAIDYVNGTIIPSYASKLESYGDEELWKEMVFNAIKDQQIRFLGAILIELKDKSRTVSLEWCNDLADYLMKKLEGIISVRYYRDTPENKRIFKENIKEKFSNNETLNKLN